jgi:hypothetical protein
MACRKKVSRKIYIYAPIMAVLWQMCAFLTLGFLFAALISYCSINGLLHKVLYFSSLCESSDKLMTGRRQKMVRIRGSRLINLRRIELDTLIRALQFEADAMTAEAASGDHHCYLSLKQIGC